MTYKFRPGSRIKGIDADTAGRELERIRTARGRLTAPEIVDEARPADALLHPAFEWDNNAAAEKYRQQQASTLTRAVFKFSEETRQMEPVYLRTSAPEIEVGDYKPVKLIVREPDLYADALRDLKSRVRSAQDAVEALERAAREMPEADAERLAKIGLAITALQTANAAVAALH